MKFRIWDKHWGDLLDPRNHALMCDGTTVQPLGYANQSISMDDENYVIQRSTGLKDKVDTEIFEGDILLCHDDFADDMLSARFRVIWHVDRWAFQMKGDEHLGGGYDWREVNKDCLVIGNEFKHPELMQ